MANSEVDKLSGERSTGVHRERKGSTWSMIARDREQ